MFNKVKQGLHQRRLKIIFLAIITTLICFIVHNKFYCKLRKYENLYDAKFQPSNGQNIFLIETENSTVNVTLNARQACAIESAAMVNPHLQVFVLYESRERLENLLITPTVKAVLKYTNVQFNYIDKEQMSEGSPVEELMRSKKLSESKYRKEHTSDVLRLLILWTFGGTYLDTDVIVKKTLDWLPSNYACVQENSSINGAVLNFDLEKGKNLSELFLKTLNQKFNGNQWSTNGPALITTVLKGLCKTNNITIMETMHDCEGFHVLRREYCYPINYVNWRKLMREDDVENSMKKVRDSMVVHFWNKMSHTETINVDSKAPYIQLARKFCPKVLETCRDFF